MCKKVWYGQEIAQEENFKATKAKLLVENKWRKAEVWDKNGNLLPFPCDLKEGERYFFVAKVRKFHIPNLLGGKS